MDALEHLLQRWPLGQPAGRTSQLRCSWTGSPKPRASCWPVVPGPRSRGPSRVTAPDGEAPGREGLAAGGGVFAAQATGSATPGSAPPRHRRLAPWDRRFPEGVAEAQPECSTLVEPPSGAACCAGVGGQIPAASRRGRGSGKPEHSKTASAGINTTPSSSRPRARTSTTSDSRPLGPPISRGCRRSPTGVLHLGGAPIRRSLLRRGWRPDPGGKPPGPGLRQAGALQDRLRRHQHDTLFQPASRSHQHDLRLSAPGTADFQRVSQNPNRSAPPWWSPHPAQLAAPWLAARSRRQAAGAGAPASRSTPRPPPPASVRHPLPAGLTLAPARPPTLGPWDRRLPAGLALAPARPQRPRPPAPAWPALWTAPAMPALSDLGRTTAPACPPSWDPTSSLSSRRRAPTPSACWTAARTEARPANLACSEAERPRSAGGPVRPASDATLAASPSGTPPTRPPG